MSDVYQPPVPPGVPKATNVTPEARAAESEPAKGAAPIPRPAPELDEFLARAVDRQIAEQRALRTTLTDLRDAVTQLQSRPTPAVDLDDLDQRIGRHVQEATGAATADLRASIGGISADVEGIAQALIDLNSGLRDWAKGIDRNLGAVMQTVERVRDVAGDVVDHQTRAMEALRSSTAQSREVQADVLDTARATADHTQQMHDELIEWVQSERERHRALEAPLIEIPFSDVVASDVVAGEIAAETAIVPMIGSPLVDASLVQVPVADVASDIAQQVKESIELSLYLADQIEDFDRVIGKMGDLPSRLEAVISQALKRTLAARGKLDREAEVAMDDALVVLDEHIEKIGRFADDEDAVRELTLRQVELASRVESLQAEMFVRLEALAEAIDRSADGSQPRAAASLARARPTASRPKTTTKAKTTKARTTKAKTTKAKTTKAKTTKAKTTKANPKRRPTRRRTPRISGD